jgi:hypothetical protein
MRRGAPLNEAGRRPVVVDLHDIEGGEGAEDPSGKPAYAIHIRRKFIRSLCVVSRYRYTCAATPRSHTRVKRASLIQTSMLTQQGPKRLQLYAVILFLVTAIICPFLPIEWSILALVYAACVFGVIGSLWIARSVLSLDTGTPEMRQVSDPIREGAEGFLKVQYTAIAKIAIPLAGLIILSYQIRPSSSEAVGVAVLGNQVLGFVAACGFVSGAVLCSALSGHLSMWVAAQSNIRVASAGRRSYGEALVVCFRGGAYRPVQSIAEASSTGHGTNIIVGVSVGMKVTLVPTLAVAVAVLTAYHLGYSTGIGSDGRKSGLFGTAVATIWECSAMLYIF